MNPQNHDISQRRVPNKRPIAIVLKGYPRLSETFIAQEILALEKLGFDIQLISLRHPTDKAVHPVNSEISANVTYLPEYIHNQPMRVLKAWWHARNIPGYRAAKRVFVKDLKRDFTRNRLRRFAQGLVIAAEFGDTISCLYSHFLHTPTSATRYGAIIAGLPFAISAHAKDIWTSPDWEISEKLADCQWLVTCTQMGCDHLRTLSPDPAKIHLVYHGLDLARFPSPESEKSERNGSDPKAPLRIVTVGRAVSKKGLDQLIIALSLLPADLHWQWQHIGGGPLRDALKAQSEQLAIDDRCQFRGALDQKEVITAYNQSDLFVMPCRIDDNGDRDGLPNVIVEAQSQGLAVISSPISGIPELIEHEKNGLLVEPDQPELLAAAILQLATDPQKRNRFGKYGEDKVRTNFDHLSSIGDLAELLDELSNQSKPDYDHA